MKKAIFSSYFEPLFYQFKKGYWASDCADPERLEMFLIAKIRRDVRDLDSHVQRVLLNITFGRKKQLIGSLQDLCIVLGSDGADIKRNLFTQSTTVLSEQQLAPFQLAIDHTLSFSQMKQSPYCYLL